MSFKIYSAKWFR